MRRTWWLCEYLLQQGNERIIIQIPAHSLSITKPVSAKCAMQRWQERTCCWRWWLLKYTMPRIESDSRGSGVISHVNNYSEWKKNSSQCQRSTDCCSGTCLSFSYKCISNSNTPFFRPPSSSQNGFVFEVGQQFPSPENAITIEELVNRFGSGNEDKDNSVLPAGSANTSPPQGTGSISGSTPTTSLIPPRPINASNTNTNPGCISSGAQVILK